MWAGITKTGNGTAATTNSKPTYRLIDRLSASGACEVTIVGALSADKLNVGLSGASDLEGKITAQDLSVDMSGSSDMKVTGEAANLKMTLVGPALSKDSNFQPITVMCMPAVPAI